MYTTCGQNFSQVQKSQELLFFLFFFSPLFGENIKTRSFAWILSFSSSCFSVIRPDLAHSHFFGLNHISKHFPELPFSCKDGDKIQKCQTEMFFSPLILVLSSSLSTGYNNPFPPLPCSCSLQMWMQPE